MALRQWREVAGVSGSRRVMCGADDVTTGLMQRASGRWTELLHIVAAYTGSAPETLIAADEWNLSFHRNKSVQHSACNEYHGWFQTFERRVVET